MEGLRKEGRGESQRKGSPTQRPREGRRGREEGREQEGRLRAKGISGGIQQRGKGDREGGLSHDSLRQSVQQKQRSQRRRKTAASLIPTHLSPPCQQEEDMKEISSAVWPRGQWTRQPLKFFHFSGNRV